MDMVIFVLCPLWYTGFQMLGPLSTAVSYALLTRQVGIEIQLQIDLSKSTIYDKILKPLKLATYTGSIQGCLIAGVKRKNK